MHIHIIGSTDGTGTRSYILTDEAPTNGLRETVVIDPNRTDIEKINAFIASEHLSLRYVIDTHTHADHITAASELQQRHHAEVIMHERTVDKWKVIDEAEKFGIKEILESNASVRVDRYVNEGDVVSLGSIALRVIYTPGHTDNHIALLAVDALFSGDLLLIGQAGRSDLPGGNTSAQYDSIYNKILKLPNDTRIYPGHDYEDNEYSTLEIERATNPFLQQKSEQDYVEFVRQFFPPIADASGDGSVVLQCGTKRVNDTDKQRYRSIAPNELTALRSSESDLVLLDVREPHELEQIGAIEGVINIPSGQLARRLGELSKEAPLVTICHAGGRSSEAAHLLAKRGFKNVYDLKGGTSGWIDQGYPVAKNTRQK